jgi:amino acid transporter
LDRLSEVRTTAADSRVDRSHETVDVRAKNIDVRERSHDPGLTEARRRFGGIDIPASLVGMLAALATLLILGGIVAAAVGALGYQLGLEDNAEELSLGSAIAGGLVILASFFVGGWAAARIARYDGVKNGLMTAVWAIVLGAILAALGAWFGSEYNVFENVGLPNWFSSDTFQTGALIGAIVSLIFMFAGAALGGARGERYHRQADAVVAATRPGGLTRAGTQTAGRVR